MYWDTVYNTFAFGFIVDTPSSHKVAHGRSTARATVEGSGGGPSPRERATDGTITNSRGEYNIYAPATGSGTIGVMELGGGTRPVAVTFNPQSTVEVSSFVVTTPILINPNILAH